MCVFFKYVCLCVNWGVTKCALSSHLQDEGRGFLSFLFGRPRLCNCREYSASINTELQGFFLSLSLSFAGVGVYSGRRVSRLHPSVGPNHSVTPPPMLRSRGNTSLTCHPSVSKMLLTYCHFSITMTGQVYLKYVSVEWCNGVWHTRFLSTTILQSSTTVSFSRMFLI
jgi:hypothetical protein